MADPGQIVQFQPHPHQQRAFAPDKGGTVAGLIAGVNPDGTAQLWIFPNCSAAPMLLQKVQEGTTAGTWHRPKPWPDGPATKGAPESKPEPKASKRPRGKKDED